MKKDYLWIRDNVIEQITESFAGYDKIHIVAHPGRFDEVEIRRLLQQTPAILTSILAIKDDDVADESYIEFVSWVLYRANNQDRMYDGALSLVSALIGVIRGLDNPVSYGGGTKIQAECLYTGSLDKINATLWAVSWRLCGRAVNDKGVIALPDDLEVFEGYDSDLLVGEQTAEDIVNLI